MSLPLVTRFGADPLLDLEVANKRYVDNSAGGGGLFWCCNSDFDIQSGGVDDFQTLYGDSQAPFTTETARPSVVVFGFTWSLMTIVVTANTVTTFDLESRVNLASGNMSIVTGGATGTFQDVTNTDSVVNEDIIDYKMSRSSGGSETHTTIASAGLEA